MSSRALRCLLGGTLLLAAGCVRAGFEPPRGDAALPLDTLRDTPRLDHAGDGPLDDRGALTDATQASVTLQWARRFGGAEDDVARDVVVDSKGRSYITGSIGGPASLGGPPLPAAATTNIFLASHSASGAHRWSKSFGDQGTNEGYAVLLDSSDNVFFTGDFEGTERFGGGSLIAAGQDDVVVASYTADGAHRWSKRYGGPGDDGPFALARNATSGDLFLTGSFRGDTNFGGPVLKNSGSWDILIVSLSATGVHRWSRRLGGAGGDAGRGVAVDGLGFVSVATEFEGSDVLGGATVTSTADDVVVARFAAANGAYVSHKQLGGAGSDIGRDVAVDAAGNSYVTGDFEASLTLDATTTLTSAGSRDIFIASFTPGGALRWSLRAGAAGEDRGHALAIDAGGNVLFVGSFRGTTTMGGPDLSAAGGSDILVASFSAGGGHRWSRRFGGPGDDAGQGVAVSAGGDVHVSGAFSGTTNFGDGDRVSAGGTDIFLLKLQQ